MTGLRLDADAVTEIARKTKDFAGDISGGKPIQDASTLPAAFDDVPGAEEVATIHAAAYDVVKATLIGVEEDLNDFATGLQNSVESLQIQDFLRGMRLNFLSPIAPLGPVIPDSQAPGLDEDALDGIANGDAPQATDTSRTEAIAEHQTGDV